MHEELSQMFALEGRTALVIGGGGTLGFEMARGLGLAGARVAITSRGQEKCDRKAAQLQALGIKALGVVMDSGDAEQLRAGLERVEREFGAVSVLINAAGGNSPQATTLPGQRNFFELAEPALREVALSNLFAGAILPCQIIGRHMAEHGRPSSIINISSITALRPLTRVVGYGTAKAGVNNFTQWLAVHVTRELGRNIRVNAIAPGFFLAEQNRALLMDGDQPTARGKSIIEHTPLGRFGEPAELVGAAIWLASEASRFVTGVVLPVDGGFSAYSGV